MPTRDYEYELAAAALEWLRIRVTHEGGQVTRFTIQYETTVADDRTPVVRCDTAHGFPHCDFLNRRGRIARKRPIAKGLPLKDALTLAHRDLVANWQRYRDAFFGDDA